MATRDTYTGRKDYFINYAKENLKRVPLDLTKDRYEEVKRAAQEQGESMNGYIKRAIEMRMKMDQQNGT